jgi:hypothetical protein
MFSKVWRPPDVGCWGAGLLVGAIFGMGFYWPARDAATAVGAMTVATVGFAYWLCIGDRLVELGGAGVRSHLAVLEDVAVTRNERRSRTTNWHVKVEVGGHTCELRHVSEDWVSRGVVVALDGERLYAVRRSGRERVIVCAESGRRMVLLRRAVHAPAGVVVLDAAGADVFGASSSAASQAVGAAALLAEQHTVVWPWWAWMLSQRVPPRPPSRRATSSSGD